MTADRRRHGLDRTPGGMLIDRDAERAWLAQMNPVRIRIARLSTTDPMCVEAEAESRNRERAA